MIGAVSVRSPGAIVAWAVFTVVALLGCGGQQEGKAKTTEAIRGLCQERREGPQTGFWFRAADGWPLVGIVRGEGRAGVVVAHGRGGSLCDELPLVDDLAGRGYMVLAYDARGSGASGVPDELDALNPTRFTADVQGAVRVLRARCVETVLLVGDSLGGTTVVAAAPYVEPAPAGVVSFGGPATLRTYYGEDLDALGRAGRLTVPLLYLVSQHDPYVSLDEARALVERAPSTDKRLIVYPGDYHAIGGLLVEAPYHETVYRTFLGFLASRAAGRPAWFQDGQSLP
jgi:alpha-beta hydrolase superfamily lysophospholipase